MSDYTCWLIAEDKPGMQNQVRGLAEALGVDWVEKAVRLRGPWRDFGPHFRLFADRGIDPAGEPLAPPWPDLLLTTGRQGVIPSLETRRRSRRRTFTVHIQGPGIAPRHFDLVVVPRHDRLGGKNVLTTLGALHRVTPARLAEAAARLGPRFDHLPRPRIAVLVGGDNAVYHLSPTITGDVADRLVALARTTGGSLLVTPSRRTGTDNEAILRARLAEVPSAVWDGQGDNPYFAFLALADQIVVTADSVSMISEACATGKAVQVIALDGGSPKFERFHAAMHAAGRTRPFTGGLAPAPGPGEPWPDTGWNETEEVAAEIHRRLDRRRAATAACGQPGDRQLIDSAAGH